jgi:predicted nucleic acid-binding protein
MIVVSDATPIVALSKIRRLNLLPTYFGEIHIPEKVYNEIIFENIEKELADIEWLKIKKVKNTTAVSYLNMLLHRGESEAIQLAIELEADLLLVDDRLARNIAKTFDLKIMGTLGILLLAWKNGAIDIKQEIDKLITSGFWIDKKLKKRIEAIIK